MSHDPCACRSEGRTRASMLECSPLAASPNLRSLSLLTDCERRLHVSGLPSLTALTHLSLAAHVSHCLTA